MIVGWKLLRSGRSGGEIRIENRYSFGLEEATKLALLTLNTQRLEA
jgi:hypothetical protein